MRRTATTTAAASWKTRVFVCLDRIADLDQRLSNMWTLVSVLCNAVVWPHGLTDAWQYPLVDVGVSYAAAALVALTTPSPLLLFLAAACIHFGAEDGIQGVCVVGCTLAITTVSQSVAEAVMLVYMLSCHVPTHYRECAWSQWRVAAVIALGVALTVLMFDPYAWPRMVTGLVVGHTAMSLMPQAVLKV